MDHCGDADGMLIALFMLEAYSSGGYDHGSGLESGPLRRVANELYDRRPDSLGFKGPLRSSFLVPSAG